MELARPVSAVVQNFLYSSPAAPDLGCCSTDSRYILLKNALERENALIVADPADIAAFAKSEYASTERGGQCPVSLPTLY